MRRSLRVFAVTGLWVVPAVVLLRLVFNTPSASPRLIQSLSPTNRGIAAFVREDTPAGYRIHFFICDGARGGRPRRVAAPFTSGDPAQLRDAVWSADGTVVAVRSAPANERCIAGYDFRRHRLIGERRNASARPALIRETLDRRGGPAKIALGSPGAFGRSAMSAAERRDYQLHRAVP